MTQHPIISPQISRLSYQLWGMAIAGFCLSGIGLLWPSMTLIMMPLLMVVAVGLLLQIYNQSRKNQQLHKTLHRYHQQIAQLEAQRPRFQPLLDAIAHEQQQRQALECASQAAQASLTELQRQLDQQHLQSQTLDTQLQVVQAALVMALNQSQARETHLLELKQENNVYDDLIDEQEQRAQQLEAQVTSLGLECDRLQAQLSDAESTIATLESDRLQIEQTCQAAQHQIAELEQELEQTRKAAQHQIASLEQELEAYRCPPTPPIYASRPPQMSDEKFVRHADIQLLDFPHPEHLEEQAKHHYHRRSSDLTPRPVTLNGIVDYLRHEFTNYDCLCDQLGCYSRPARNILKARVNAQIWDRLSEMRLTFDDVT
ncbi:MAG: hypothetical protein EA367_17360 [Leptolyngbya sp. DLM2.Bin15]|nr:MAG: hypothetical protein EA367_17360 [Leptolyngbya sp. DLM2.Bin15]